MKILTFVTCGIMALSGLSFGQGGSLTPPSSTPSAGMLSLEQLQPRVPLIDGADGVTATSGGGFTISAAGSYYLTEHLTISSGDGITIDADNVVLDLMGFTVKSGFSASGGRGILINSDNVTIRNGAVSGGTSYSASSAPSFSGNGFAYGVYASSGNLHPIRLENIQVNKVSLIGIYLPAANTFATSCSATVTGGRGIYAGNISNCLASVCNSIALRGVTVTGSYGHSIDGDGIYGTTISNSYGESDGSDSSDDGIQAVSSVHNCYGTTGGGDAITSKLVVNSVGVSGVSTTGRDGIQATIAIGSSATNGKNITNEYDMP